MKNITRKGFTLVELLIVIVVIGILSAMMMLSSTEAVSSAKANNIVNNLRNWKTAALSWYVDNIDRITPAGKVKNESGTGENDFAHSGVTMDIAKYLSNTFEATSDTRFVKDSAGGRYYVDHIEKSGKYVRVAETKNATYLLKDLQSGTDYTILVHAFSAAKSWSDTVEGSVYVWSIEELNTTK